MFSHSLLDLFFLFLKDGGIVSLHGICLIFIWYFSVFGDYYFILVIILCMFCNFTFTLFFQFIFIFIFFQDKTNWDL
jgi:hypothetical protein